MATLVERSLFIHSFLLSFLIELILEYFFVFNNNKKQRKRVEQELFFVVSLLLSIESRKKKISIHKKLSKDKSGVSAIQSD